jgi:hypothetical protein
MKFLNNSLVGVVAEASSRSNAITRFVDRVLDRLAPQATVAGGCNPSGTIACYSYCWSTTSCGSGMARTTRYYDPRYSGSNCSFRYGECTQCWSNVCS